MASADDVQMQMEYGLTSVFAVVEYHPKSLRCLLLTQLTGHQHQVPEELHIGRSSIL